MIEMSNIVWEAKLDQIYQCKTERTGESTGILKIEEDDRVLFEKPVTLSFGALFGPDIADVQEWEQTCIDFVDELNK